MKTKNTLRKAQKPSNNRRKWLIGGGIALGLMLLAGGRAKASDKLPGTADPSLIISDFDGVWDYTYMNGEWYTRRKGVQAWTNMRTALSAENYALAVSRLEAFIKNKLQPRG